jgi:hypothetical protein
MVSKLAFFLAGGREPGGCWRHVVLTGFQATATAVVVFALGLGLEGF